MLVEDEQEDAVEDEEVVRGEDLSDEEARTLQQVQWSGWCQHGRCWRTRGPESGPGGEEG
jgi:hypothetical protein